MRHIKWIVINNSSLPYRLSGLVDGKFLFPFPKLGAAIAKGYFAVVSVLAESTKRAFLTDAERMYPDLTSFSVTPRHLGSENLQNSSQYDNERPKTPSRLNGFQKFVTYSSTLPTSEDSSFKNLFDICKASS